MISTRDIQSLVLPALRGTMGDWVYYCCLMDLPTLANRVDYARDLHKSEQLSEMIQRELDKRRSKEVAEYLRTRPDRLFNALVVATYGGRPNWHALTNVQSRGTNDLSPLTDETMLSVGFLTLRGDEKLFALDGQHRLSGIKRTAEEHQQVGIAADQVPVMFVAHETTDAGLRRTRRLFTTLNKTARPVSKFGIIALDEDDVMALTVRWLVDENADMFGGARIAFIASSNLPKSNVTSLTTIVNLYDILKTWYMKADTQLRASSRTLHNHRPDDHRLTDYYEAARRLFEELRRGFPELDAFFSTTDTEQAVIKYRNTNALYRPVGLHVFVSIVAQLTHEMDLPAAVAEATKLPRSLDSAPFAGLMWNPHTRTIRRFARNTLLELLLHMLGRSKRHETELLRLYRKDVGDNSIHLPDPVI